MLYKPASENHWLYAFTFFSVAFSFLKSTVIWSDNIKVGHVGKWGSRQKWYAVSLKPNWKTDCDSTTKREEEEELCVCVVVVVGRGGSYLYLQSRFSSDFAKGVSRSWLLTWQLDETKCYFGKAKRLTGACDAWELLLWSAKNDQNDKDGEIKDPTNACWCVGGGFPLPLRGRECRKGGKRETPPPIQFRNVTRHNAKQKRPLQWTQLWPHDSGSSRLSHTHQWIISHIITDLHKASVARWATSSKSCNQRGNMPALTFSP